MKFEWEVLIEENISDGFNTLRAKIIGGWALKHMCWDDENHTQSESMVFIPDPNHRWKIDG